MKSIIVAAVSDNGIIGSNSKLPWKLPRDTAFFEDLIKDKFLFMGRKTFESSAVPKPLPGLHTFILTRDESFDEPNCTRVNSVFEAAIFVLQKGGKEFYILGGGQAYDEAIDHCEYLLITEVHANVIGDTHFPEISTEDWVECERVDYPADAENEHAMSFVKYERLN